MKPKSKKKDGRGGVRPGAGRPKGPDPHTVAVRKATERFHARVARAADKLFDAQLSKAIGEAHLFRKVRERNEEGKIIRTYFEEVTSPKKIQEYLDGEFAHGHSVNDNDEFYYITTKSPDNAAIVAMLDRGLGKPAENINADIMSGGERITAISEKQFAQLARARTERGNI